jgi:ATP-dependent DNA helicase RecQ
MAPGYPRPGRRANVAKAHNIAEQLDALTDGASFVVGHNLLRHDIPVLRQRFPQLRLLALPIVDTLELSPIAFPQNPYHSLVKDYKLVRDTRSDPLKDAQLALKLWQDQFDAFKALGETLPEELACHHYLLTRDPDAGVGSFFTTLRRAKAPSPEEVKAAARNLLNGKVCATRSTALLGEAIDDPAAANRCPTLSPGCAWPAAIPSFHPGCVSNTRSFAT